MYPLLYTWQQYFKIIYFVAQFTCILFLYLDSGWNIFCIVINLENKNQVEVTYGILISEFNILPAHLSEILQVYMYRPNTTY